MELLGIKPEIWFPVVTLVMGAILKAVFDYFTDSRQAKRETIARQDTRDAARRDARDAFQRATLLDLQDALAAVARFTYRSYHEDFVAFRTGGAWKKNLLSDEVNDGSRLASVRFSMLKVRVRDRAIRHAANDFAKICNEIMFATSETQATRLVNTTFSSQADTLQELIGAQLRTIDEAP